MNLLGYDNLDPDTIRAFREAASVRRVVDARTWLPERPSWQVRAARVCARLSLSLLKCPRM